MAAAVAEIRQEAKEKGIDKMSKRTLQEVDRGGIRPCPNLVVETDLGGQVDFNQLFAELDEPTE